MQRLYLILWIYSLSWDKGIGKRVNRKYVLLPLRCLPAGEGQMFVQLNPSLVVSHSLTLFTAPSPLLQTTAFQKNPTKTQKALLPPYVNPRKEKTMKQLRTNMRALHQHTPHSKLTKTTLKCFDILACVCRDLQAGRLPCFPIPSNT